MDIMVIILLELALNALLIVMLVVNNLKKIKVIGKKTLEHITNIVLIEI